MGMGSPCPWVRWAWGGGASRNGFYLSSRLSLTVADHGEACVTALLTVVPGDLKDNSGAG